jgi:hypothetical protein
MKSQGRQAGRVGRVPIEPIYSREHTENGDDCSGLLRHPGARRLGGSRHLDAKLTPLDRSTTYSPECERPSSAAHLPRPHYGLGRTPTFLQH